MKLNTTVHDVEMSVDNPTQAFSIKTTAKAFKILSDGLYKNKILAFVRELSRNAYDAHIAAGRKNVPFEIHLPNMLEPWFHVKDFGTGLSHENVLHLYTTYFESTKQNSNDFVGALGLGSKSPFSYVTKFEVKSRYDGVETFYSCFLTPQGVPSIIKIGEGKYTGHPGLEIVLPIERNDFNAVRTAVSQDLAFWEGTVPNVVGDSQFKINPPTKNIVGKDWYTTTSRHLHGGVPVAVQGNVGYPIATDLLRQKADTNERATIDVIRRLNPIMTFEIGKLDVTASREELSYDEPTIRNIIDAIVRVVDEFGEKFKTEVSELEKETTEFAFRNKGYDLVTRYQDAYGADFIRFFSAKIPHVTWNKKNYTLQDLLKRTKTFYIEGLTPIGMYSISKRWRGKADRVKKDPHGQVLLFEGSKNATIANVDSLYSGNRGYGDYRMFGWWDTTKNVLPRRPRDSKQTYEHTLSVYSDKKNANPHPKTFTCWSFEIFGNRHNNGKTVILLNDQQVFGYEIVAQYMVENSADAVFVIDYNKRHVTPKQVADFVKVFTTQLTGLKILSTSQLVLKNPVVKAPRAKKAAGPVRNVNEVTNFVRPTVKSTSDVSARTFGYSSHASPLMFKMDRVYNGSTVEDVDFTTGDFYYFYELRNKMYLDEKYTQRVDASNYLNALSFLGIIPAGTAVVGLKPTQIKKILKQKKKGKLIPVSEFDKKLFESARRNNFLAKANIIVKAGVFGSQIDGPISELFQSEEMAGALKQRYGDLSNGNSDILLFEELKDVLAINAIFENEGVRKVFTVLGMIRYYADGTNRSYRDAWTILFKDVNVDAEASKLTKQIKDCVTAFYTKYPLLRAISVSDFRYNNNRVARKMEVIEHMIDYVNLKNGKKSR